MKEEMFKQKIKNYYNNYDMFRELFLTNTDDLIKQAKESQNEYFDKMLNEAINVSIYFGSICYEKRNSNIDEEKVYNEIRKENGENRYYWESYDEAIKYIYLPLYHIYRELQCLVCHLDITDETYINYKITNRMYKNAISHWMNRYPQNITGFHYINQIITENIFKDYIKQNSTLKNQYKHIKQMIKKEIMVDRPFYTYPDEERYKKTYMFYYILSKYSYMFKNKKFFNKFSETMLEEIGKFLEVEEIIQIRKEADNIINAKEIPIKRNPTIINNKTFKQKLENLYSFYGNIIGYFCGLRNYAEKFPKNLENCLKPGIDYSEEFLKKFIEVTDAENTRNKVYTSIFLDSYGVKATVYYQKLNRYKCLYSMYRFLYCIDLFEFIKNEDLNEKLKRIIKEYEKEIIKWDFHDRHEKYDNFWSLYSKMYLETTEEVIQELMDYKIDVDDNVQIANQAIFSDMKLEKPIDSYEENEKYIYKYMYYYILPHYIDDPDAKRIVNKISLMILEELDPFVNDDIIDKIRIAAKDFVDQKKAKEKSKK